MSIQYKMIQRKDYINPDEIRAESIKVKRLVFKPSKVLIKRIKDAKFVRAAKL